jgi:hypothetical protein
MKINFLFSAFLCAFLIVNGQSAFAGHGNQKITAGWVENVIFEAGQTRLRAKLDTGAKTSSIHAENVKRFERDGQTWVRFTLPKSFKKNDKERQVVERPLVRTVLIKRHKMESAKRSVVELSFCMYGHYYTTEFTLANRSNYNYPVLLGRQFLSNNVLVDSSDKHVHSPMLKELVCSPELAGEPGEK